MWFSLNTLKHSNLPFCKIYTCNILGGVNLQKIRCMFLNFFNFQRIKFMFVTQTKLKKIWIGAMTSLFAPSLFLNDTYMAKYVTASSLQEQSWYFKYFFTTLQVLQVPAIHFTHTFLNDWYSLYWFYLYCTELQDLYRSCKRASINEGGKSFKKKLSLIFGELNKPQKIWIQFFATLVKYNSPVPASFASCRKRVTSKWQILET